MNKKEISEIKKQFKFDNDHLAIFGIGTYFVKSFNIESSDFKYFADTSEFEAGFSPSNCWDELEEVCFLDIIKKTLGGSLGKSLVEYSFPYDVITDEKSQYPHLLKVLKDFNEEEAEKYAKFLAEKIKLDDDYTILLQKASYSVPTKDVNGEKVDEEYSSGDTYDFITVSICPVNNSKPNLFVDGTDDSVKHKPILREIGAPLIGFAFPTFNERATDVNSVLVFNKKPKEPCLTLIEDCLGCVYNLNPEDEQTKFNNLISKLVDSDNVDYDITKNIHDEISEIIENTSANTELTELSKLEIKKIIENSGIAKEKLDNFDEIFDEEIGDYKLKAVNLVDNGKLNIKSPDIVINIKNDSTDKINSKVIDGKKCLVIEFDENIEINGLNVSL